MTRSERGSAVAGLPRFPLLVKLLFTSDKLSVQLHPDDEFARKYEGEPWGKSEVWYVLEAEPGAWVRVGLKEQSAREELGRLLGTAGIEDALQRIVVRAGDVVSVPAGTLHSLGPGLILCEIQQYSDVTYRVYDYERPGLDGRPRSLHLEKARGAIKLDSTGAGLQTPAPRRDAGEGRILFAGPRFGVEQFESGGRVKLASDPAHFDLMVTLAGSGRIKAVGAEMEFGGVEAFLVTADAGGIEVLPDAPSRWLRTYPIGQWQ
jgi:mannose-6-phosphate isomerase